MTLQSSQSNLISPRDFLKISSLPLVLGSKIPSTCPNTQINAYLCPRKSISLRLFLLEDVRYKALKFQTKGVY